MSLWEAFGGAQGEVDLADDEIDRLIEFPATTCCRNRQDGVHGHETNETTGREAEVIIITETTRRNRLTPSCAAASSIYIAFPNA